MIEHSHAFLFQSCMDVSLIHSPPFLHPTSHDSSHPTALTPPSSSVCPFSFSEIIFRIPKRIKKLKKKRKIVSACLASPRPEALRPLLLLKMEGSENQLGSYFQQQQQSSSSNGLLPNAEASSHMVFPHSVPSAVSSQLEPPKRKRGRPRKYGTPEQALAAKKAATSSFSSHSFHRDKKSPPSLPTPPASSKKSPSPSPSPSLGQGFTPHVISVAAGEDVGQKIMLFMQQSRREMCILSASGSISNASLRQPATSGGNIAYEGRFEIISLSGSYVRTELGGRTGGLSVCLSSTDGQIIGGGVGGPLKAAGPVQVIVGTFFLDVKKDAGASAVKGDAPGSKLASLVGESVSSLGYQPGIESSGGNPIHGNDDDQHAVGGSHFMIQQRGVHVTSSQPTEWWARPDSRNAGFEQMTGKTGHGAHHSPENGDYLT